jgi:hypothetical protein
MHGNARKDDEQVKTCNDSRQQEGKEVKELESLEMMMINFQNPQVRKETFGANFFFG